jgi:uncharacterized membrane protein (DUF485 family)
MDQEPPPVGDAEIKTLFSVERSLSRSFVAANAGSFALLALLAVAGGDLLAAQIAGQVTIGMVLGLIQMGILVLTALRFDRGCSSSCDPLAETLRARVEHQSNADAHAFPTKTRRSAVERHGRR